MPRAQRRNWIRLKSRRITSLLPSPPVMLGFVKAARSARSSHAILSESCSTGLALASFNLHFATDPRCETNACANDDDDVVAQIARRRTKASGQNRCHHRFAELALAPGERLDCHFAKVIFSEFPTLGSAQSCHVKQTSFAKCCGGLRSPRPFLPPFRRGTCLRSNSPNKLVNKIASTFDIPKRASPRRRINEPLPSLPLIRAEF